MERDLVLRSLKDTGTLVSEALKEPTCCNLSLWGVKSAVCCCLRLLSETKMSSVVGVLPSQLRSHYLHPRLKENLSVWFQLKLHKQQHFTLLSVMSDCVEAFFLSGVCCDLRGKKWEGILNLSTTELIINGWRGEYYLSGTLRAVL